MSIKTNNFFLDKDIENEICKQIENCTQVTNATLFYSLSLYFNISKLSETSLRSIERHFQTVADSPGFLELQLRAVKKILASSELCVDSEHETFNSANNWLKHDFVERSKHAEDLLLRVRLSLLSQPALDHIFNGTTPIAMDDKCREIIRAVEINKKGCQERATSRYCSQDDFKIMFVGGQCRGTVVRNVLTVKAGNLSEAQTLPELNHGRQFAKAVCVKGEVYVFGGVDCNLIPVMSVERYSPATGTWDI